MIDATEPLGMARLMLLLHTGCDCWNVVSTAVARQFYADAVAALQAL